MHWFFMTISFVQLSLSLSGQDICSFCNWKPLTKCGFERSDACMGNNLTERWSLYRRLDPHNVHKPVSFELASTLDGIQTHNGNRMLIGKCEIQTSTPLLPYFDTSVLNLKYDAPYRLRLTFWYSFPKTEDNGITFVDVRAIKQNAKSERFLSSLLQITQETGKEWRQIKTEFEVPEGPIALRFTYHRKDCSAHIALDEFLIEQSHTTMFTTTPLPDPVVTANVWRYESNYDCDWLPGDTKCDPTFTIIYRIGSLYQSISYRGPDDSTSLELNLHKAAPAAKNSTVVVDITIYDRDGFTNNDSMGSFTFRYTVPSEPTAEVIQRQSLSRATMYVKFHTSFS